MRGTSKKPKGNPAIARLRAKINRIDDQVLSLVNQRASAAREIGRLKEKVSDRIYLPSREEEIFERLEKVNKGPFPTDSIKPVFREIISACRSLERNLRVAYLGPEAAFTHIAAREQFGHKTEFRPELSVKDVFESVEKGAADFGVVPVENSTEGVVAHTLDMFLDSNLNISAEIILRIHHCLLASAKSMDRIEQIYSHYQALAQCRSWLRKILPNVEVRDAASTSEAARFASEATNAAAIASEYAAEFYGLKILARDIEDLKHNYTRFFVVGKRGGERTGNDLTMIMFSLKDQPGVLYRSLAGFAARKINLTKIESRPLKGKAWEYIFFVEMEGHIEDQKVGVAMKELSEKCVFVRVLGSFPRTRRIPQEVII
jgi:chorismate mutase / prephenate dehydratase